MRALVAAEVVSSLGSLMSVVALPWFVLETTGSPGRMSAVLAAEAAPIALLGLASGRIAARLGPRRSLLLCDAVWAPAVALIPILHAAGALSFGLLLSLAFLTGLPWPLHYGAQAALLPELAGEGEAPVARANAILGIAGRLAYFAGPALGGALLALTSASAVLALDAATFACSFVVVATLVRGVGDPEPARPAGGIGAGLGRLTRDPILRRLTAAQILSQAAFMGLVAAVPVLVFERFDRDAAVAGRLLGAWGLGALAGGAIALPLVRRHAPLALGAAAWCLQAAALWLLVPRPGEVLAIAALVLSGLGNGIRVPPIAGVFTARLPAGARAGTLTVSTALVLSGGFAALLLAGPVLATWGARPVLVALAAAQTLAAAIVLALAVRARRPAPVAVPAGP
jgi:hypothetical protein